MAGRRPAIFPCKRSRRFSLRRKKFHVMEVEFAVFPRHGTQIMPFFHGMEVTFLKSSTPWNPLLSPLILEGRHPPRH
jgi:hypothetical protein